MRVKLILMSLVMCQAIYSQKIFPGAVGYGTDSRGAYGGSVEPIILTVNTLNSQSISTGERSGSFAWCLDQSYPRIIVFEVGGVIDCRDYNWYFTVDQPYVSVYGQTAPSPGITIRGASFNVATHDVLIQHIKFRAGDAAEGMIPGSRDCIAFNSGADNVVIDHCTFNWSIDELVGITSYATGDYTFSNNMFAEPLLISLHGGTHPEWHAYCLLTYTCNLTVYRNLFAFSQGRTPMLRPGKKVVINNYTYATGAIGSMIYSHNSNDFFGALVGNVSESLPLVNKMIETHDVGSTPYGAWVLETMTPASRLYVEDNVCPLSIANPGYTQWNLVRENNNITQATTSPVDLSEYSIMSSAAVKDYVLANAGAFYWDRDYVEQRVIDTITAGGAYFCNSPNPLPAICHWLYCYMPPPNRLVSGYDWSTNNQTIIINGTTITLNQNCASSAEVASYINSLLPGGFECKRTVGSAGEQDYVQIQTIATGSGASFTIDGTALPALSMSAGTYRGSDGSGFNFGAGVHTLDLPTNPHGDDNGNGYTNIEEWAFSLTSSSEVNHAPVIQNGSATIDDSQTNGEFVAKVSASDPDAGQQLTYSITSGNSSNLFAINSSNGNITIANSNALVNFNSVNLTVRVTDNGSPSLYTEINMLISITHNSLNEPPVLNGLKNSITIDEDQSYTLLIDDLDVSDPDSDIGSLNLVILSGDNYTVSGTTITPVENYNGTLSVELYVTDQENASSSRITAEITVREVNDSPVINDQEFNVYESEELNALIGHIETYDPDDNQELDFIIIDGNEGDIFEIDDLTGNLYFKSLGIDFYSVPRYELNVQITDNGSPLLSGSATISIHMIGNDKVYYIDPTNLNDPLSDGTIDHPYASWDQVSWEPDVHYLQKTGTNVSLDNEIVIQADGVHLGSYGQGSRPVIENNTSSGYAFKAIDRSNIHISNIEITATGAIACLYFLGGNSRENKIEDCSFKNNDYGIRIVDGESFYISKCTFENNLVGIFTITDYIDISYNNFVAQHTAISFNGTASTAKLFNNVFYDNNLSINALNAEMLVYNNIFYFASDNDMAILSNDDRFRSDYNIYFPDQMGFMKVGDRVYNSLYEFQDQMKYEKHSFIDNPLLKDADRRNFQIEEGSPAIDAGVYVGLLEDMYGATVPIGDAPDIGSFEANYSALSLQHADNSIETMSVNVFPNPSAGYFNINLINEGLSFESVEVYDNLGKTVAMDISEDGSDVTRLNMTGHPAGIYLLKIRFDDESMFTQKIIIKR